MDPTCTKCGIKVQIRKFEKAIITICKNTHIHDAVEGVMHRAHHHYNTTTCIYTLDLTTGITVAQLHIKI